ncbi:hypothetical protein E8L99_15290 [Phreatobacter aquaticus]|uniref:Uncharacterized protein n=1 Tax=Phreatobacter aquaticus TaxID=2570229 RepID=A0A4D7QQ30_9HYPH|nr:hypothetical protein [Phreatobacter aquaticus]QCK87027.1 hypothetical protein E8L99_15290 [Phreatobacter aquaticus]
MRRLVLTALAAVAGLGAVAAAPSKADAQVAIGFGIASPMIAEPVQYYPPPYRGDWGPRRHWDGPPPGFYRPPPPRWGPPPPRHCWVERRWVETPWGPRPRPVRVCR